jgi:hypothetical protein
MMTVDAARRHLAGHGLVRVVIMRDGVEVPEADLKVRSAVWVGARGTKVERLLART